jgi:death-on-curing protein
VPFLTVEEVLAAHARVKGIPVASAIDHVHRMEVLESAVARPQNALAYEGADLVAQAATLLWGLVRNHPFSDGNKRTALVALLVFLDINERTLEMSEDEKFELVIGIANGGITVDQTEAMLRTRLRSQPPR